MVLPSLPFQGSGLQKRPSDSSSILWSSSSTHSRPGAYVANLWRRAENANSSKLSSLTLAHIMSGDTVPPISFSDFEAFLAFSDISLENLHFIIWFQDYRARYLNEQDTEARESALQSKEQRENSTQFSETTQDICEEYSTAVSSGALEGVNSLGSDVSSQLRNGNILDYGSRASIEGQRKKQAFRSEVNNILATFLVPDARKELLLCSSMRDKAISDAKQSTDPDIFLPIYQIIYESVETVSLPRFLAYASTNINRPRQLFWYFSALPMFLLGVAIALIFIMSSSPHFIVPPQAHRAWRLFSVPCFFLSSLMWYKGYRGFCPLLWFRSSTQLRVWELETMADDEEAQAYVSESGTKDNCTKHSRPSPSFSSSTSQTARIAPFLDLDEPDQKSTASTSSEDEVIALESQRRRQASSGLNAQFRSRRSRFSRPPIFGPDRVVEETRIRAVHRSLAWALIRFGLFWAAVSGAVVVGVPSWHVN